MEIGQRVNFHSEYGSNYVFNFNPFYTFNKRLKLFTNVSSGFRTPSLYQLFSEYGNRELKPEAAINAEAGIQYFSKANRFTGRLTAFTRNVKDVIFFYFNPSTFQSQYINQDKQKDHGAEVELSCSVNKTTLKGSYSYVTGKITTQVGGKDTTYFNLLRRPEHTLNFFAGHQLMDRLFISTNVLAVGKRKDSYFDPQTFLIVNVDLKSYLLWDVYAEYRFLKDKLKIFAELKNILNQEYNEVAGFNTMSFNWSAGVRVNFK